VERAKPFEQYRLRLGYWRLQNSMGDLARNADGDQLLFVHRGSGELFCDYGHLAIVTGDYIVVPRGTMWRIDCAKPMTFCSSRRPGRAINARPRHCRRTCDFRSGDPGCSGHRRGVKAQQDDRRKWRVRVKRRGEISTVTYPFNPLDAVGWHGDLAPVRLNVKDIRR